MYQGKKWDWKRIAARVLLIPVLAGGAAGAATAQPRKPAGDARPAADAKPATDPKAMLKEGRKALADGRFNDARDLAQRADASNPSGKWGLFDDTPNSLRQDAEAARLKAQKAEAEALVKQAKALAAKPTGSDPERAANLDSALRLARRADQLHGPYSAWEFGDRADKVVKEIEDARVKIRSLPTPPPAATAATPAPAGTRPFASTLPRPAAQAGGAPATGVMTAAGTGPAAPVTPASATKAPALTPPSPFAIDKPKPAATAVAGPVAPTAATDPKKAAAVKLMAEGKALADNGDFAAAHAKYTEAAKAGAVFGEREYNPGFALQELSARGAAAIDRLVKDAQARIAQKDFEKADAALSAAGTIATALNLFARPIDEAKSALRLASNGKHGGVPPGGLSPVAGPEKVVAVAVAGPLAPTGGPAQVVAAPTPVPAVAGVAAVGDGGKPAGSSVTGRQLLDQADLQFRQGDYDAARRLAVQAHNLGGSHDEATGLLNQIDAEVFAAKQRTAEKSFAAAVAAAHEKDHGHALSILVLIDPKLLPAESKAKRDALIASCRGELDKADGQKADAAVVAAGGTQPPAGDLPSQLGTPPAAAGSAPGTARVGPAADPKAASPDNLASQADAMKRVAFQKLRADGLKVQADAQATFGRGETDVAIRMLADYQNRVRAANLEPATVAMLLRPVDSRLEMFTLMKGQTDAVSRQKKESRDAKELVVGRGAAEEQRKAEVQRLVRECNRLVKEKGDYAAAERVAMQAKQLEPDDPAIGALAHMVKTTRRVKDAEKIKGDKEKMVLGGLNDAEKEGPLVTSDDPVAFRVEMAERVRRRGGSDEAFLRTMTPAMYDIELKLEKPVSLDFTQTPLSEAIENVRTLTGLPISFDSAAIEAEAVSLAKPVTERLPSISARNALSLLLDKAGLSFVIEYDTVRVTTVKRAKGRLYTKVFSVADLVTPIPNFALPDYANFDKMINRNAFNSGKAMIGGLNTGGPNGVGGTGGRGGLGGGTMPGAAATMPGIAGGGGGGSLDNSTLTQSATLANERNTKHEQLIKLVTSMVRPNSWDAQGGAGKVEYFDLGSALVVNQTADVINEVRDLLESLRRLQDLAVAVEVRIISLSETWFERMGVDFAMNIKTNTTKFEPSLTTNTFRPEPFINDISARGTTVGLTPAGSFTPDLDVPIRATSFQRAIPPFGGYPNSPGMNGGVSLGLAFLNDIQVYLFMEAAQGDRRVNVMQAPKLTLFNGQTATIAINDLQFFVTDVQVYSVNGQIVFIPQNTPLPGPGQGGINISLQAVVSADRRFVRINIPVTLSTQTGATVPLFPITTFITPVFEGGSQGQPIPFTQFLQQPSFTTLNIQTTVVCPDGGTVLLGGLKTLGEGRNESGPPFLSKVPYLNRLFKNVGIGRETTHIMIMITPRIIINAEEEINQTEGGGPLGSRPGQ